MSQVAGPSLSPVGDRLAATLRHYLQPVTAAAAIQACCRRCGVRPSGIREADLPRLIELLDVSLRLSLDAATKRRALTSLRGLVDANAAVEARTIEIKTEHDIRTARLAALELAQAVGFPQQDATKVATVVSELSRNVLAYAGTGSVHLTPLDSPPTGISVTAEDHGPGIAALDAILAGNYHSKQGLGLGLRGSKRMMDTFQIDTAPDRGTRIVATKHRRT